MSLSRTLFLSLSHSLRFCFGREGEQYARELRIFKAIQFNWVSNDITLIRPYYGKISLKESNACAVRINELRTRSTLGSISA